MIDLLLITTASAGAEYSLDGEVREVGRMISDFPVDAEGTNLGQGTVLEQRLRLGGGAHWDRLHLSLAGDLLTGPLAGDPWDIAVPEDNLGVDQRGFGTIDPVSLDGFALRRAAIRGRAGPVQLEGGVVTSQWGLGMVANDGDQFRMFGQTRFGDRVIRMRATTSLPNTPLYFTGAVDRVLEDDLARMFDGQIAHQALVSALYAGENNRKLGAYLVYRTQDEEDEIRTTNAKMLDVFGNLEFTGLGMDWRMAAEAAGITGTTNRALSYNALDVLAVSSMGATGLIEMTRGSSGLMLRGGYASGDGNLDDDTTNDFSFDRDFEVGMVLFPEVMGAVGSGTYALLDDPQYTAEPPPGAEGLVTEGAFQKATFFSPVLLSTPMPWLTLRAGAVLAWATAPISQPFYTTRAGGTPTNHHDLPTTGYRLGSELDWAVGVGREVASVGEMSVRGSLEAQGGHGFLSADVAGDGPDRIDLYTLAGRLSW